MADEIKNKNILLVNAPAGSGKTYRIKSEIRDYIIENPQDKILCITYTNRAANELLKDIDSPNVYISTIHSYINDMISPLFKKQEIIDLYFEIYTYAINKRIADPEKQESNNKYKEKFGDIDIDIIKQNVKAVSYNETQFNSLYYGGLSHDDLLSFTFKVLEKHPKLYQKINRRFKRIIIDEYQDTSPEVLYIFFNAVKNTEVQLYLYGDKMQQIYKNYDNELNDKLSTIKHDDRKIINHRSIPVIVNILNKIYNKTELNQEHFEKIKNIQPDFPPRIIVVEHDKFDEIINQIITQDPKSLVLYIFNRERFEKIGASNLFNAYSRIEKYGLGKKVSVVNVLLNNDEKDNPDDLLKFIIIMYKANECWRKKTYGTFLKICRDNKNIFNTKLLSLYSITDKEPLYKLWEEIFDKYNDQDTTMGQLINLMNSKKLLYDKFIEAINTDNIYSDVLNVNVNEFIKLENSNMNPNVSTQHGVKGESHDSVVFVAEDSKRNKPQVYMYDFFKVWSQADFSLDRFEDFYFEYYDFTKQIQNQEKEYLISKSKEIIEKFKKNNIFNILCKNSYLTYIDHPTVANLKNCFKDSTIGNVLSAYKLFYVGCSRASKNLTILIDKDKILEFENDFRKKAKSVGFHCINY